MTQPQAVEKKCLICREGQALRDSHRQFTFCEGCLDRFGEDRISLVYCWTLAAVEEERERCAKIAESCGGLMANDLGYLAALTHVGVAKHISDKIREGKD